MADCNPAGMRHKAKSQGIWAAKAARVMHVVIKTFLLSISALPKISVIALTTAVAGLLLASFNLPSFLSTLSTLASSIPAALHLASLQLLQFVRVTESTWHSPLPRTHAGSFPILRILRRKKALQE